MDMGINKIELQKLRKWFAQYVLSFKGTDSALAENSVLKEQHTYKVCQAILDIGKSLCLNEGELRLAETIALFHDLGRFEQYRKYGTFMDSKSVNHAEFGIEILLANKTIDHLDADTKELIIKAIKYHNRPSVPASESKELLLYARLIRDADKLDIYRVVTQYYEEQKQGRHNKAIELELPDTAGISEEISMAVTKREVVKFGDVKNLNDFKLLQLAWVYDVNFPFTFRHIKNRKYLEAIWDSMNHPTRDRSIFLCVSDHLDSSIAIHAEHELNQIKQP